jgi:bifunctional non-homologous end joining protein LigD
MSKATRRGKIFVDYLRNDEGSTAIAAYSTRARAGAPVATPVAWNELSKDIRFDYFNVRNLPARLKRLKMDPWADFFDTAAPTKPMMKKIGCVRAPTPLSPQELPAQRQRMTPKLP